MKPKTKLQHQVVELSNKLPAITSRQKQWALKHCLEHEAVRLKSGKTYCLDCGREWMEKLSPLMTSIDGCTCPSCGQTLKVKQTRKRKFTDAAYFCIITTYQGFQVLRYFLVEGDYRIGNPAYLSCDEIVRFWITPTGRFEITAKLRVSGWYAERWTGAFELRCRHSDSYHLKAYKYYPERKYITEVKRNGFKGNFHGLQPYRFMQLVLSNTKAETLLKAGQYDLLKSMPSYGDSIKKYWPSIRISIRNNYNVTDASLWIDYIKFLEYFDKDIRSAKYVCPADLKGAHDFWMNKHRKAEEKRREEERRLQALKDEDDFKKLKGKFFGIAFGDEKISIKVLESVQEYLDEGKIMHHCVGSYALRKDSLVFSARIDGKPIETIEVSLKTFEVVQSRGVCNKNTEYHDRIIALVNKNKKLIKECTKPKRKYLAKNELNLNTVAV